MIRLLFLVLMTFMLLSGIVVAQDDAPKQPPDEPVVRTAEDIEAIRLLDAEAIRAIESTEPRPISHITFPTTINVGITKYAHCSDWLANNRAVEEVITIDFREYVKNVLPNEWVHNWPVESLRSGAVAVKMFAWWRINLTEQYPGSFRPEGVHVVDNTCDQVYYRNSNRPATNAAVDETWPYRLHLDEYVQEIHYLAYDFQCSQAFGNFAGGWSRCLPQWTTKDMADAGATWQEMVEQYYTPISIAVTEDMPVDVNVMQNASFNNGTQGWLASRGVRGTGVTNGVYDFFADKDGAPARIWQDVNKIFPSNAPVNLRVALGNSGSTPKEVTVRLLRSDGVVEAGTCTFTLLPNRPPLVHHIWGTTPDSWTGMRVEISADTADGVAGYLVDNADLRLLPYTPREDDCLPPLPGTPDIVAPGPGMVYGNTVDVTLSAGASNMVEDYAPAFQIQIDESSTFELPVYDNEDEPSDAPLITVEIPDGTWYLRARQYDGVSRWSLWSPAVRFETNNLPDEPTPIAPVGEVPASGQSFIWLATAQTDTYRITIRNAAAETIFNQVVSPVQIECTWVCTLPFSATSAELEGNQPYAWAVSSMNSQGEVTGASSDFVLIP